MKMRSRVLGARQIAVIVILLKPRAALFGTEQSMDWRSVVSVYRQHTIDVQTTINFVIIIILVVYFFFVLVFGKKRETI